MAAIDINDSAQMRFANGGKIIISDATNDYTVLTIVDGTLRVAEGGREISMISSAGALLPPTLGNERPSVIEADFYMTNESGSSTLETLMSHASVADALAPEFDVVIEWYADTGQTTGRRISFSNCHFTAPIALQASGNPAGPDTVQLRMASRDMHGTWAAIV